MQRNRLGYLTTLIVVVVLGAACSSGDTTATTMAPDMDMEEGDHAAEFEFGSPMEAADATRVIEIEARDDLTFSPASVQVAADETVTFRVTNVGAIDHDFTLGDSHMQDEHEAEMAEMAGMAMHDEPNAFVLKPGETKEMTWHMTTSGEILFGCHQPAHYAAGMVGTITIGG